jgi:hypothetical protein
LRYDRPDVRDARNTPSWSEVVAGLAVLRLAGPVAPLLLVVVWLAGLYGAVLAVLDTATLGRRAVVLIAVLAAALAVIVALGLINA